MKLKNSYIYIFIKSEELSKIICELQLLKINFKIIKNKYLKINYLDFESFKYNFFYLDYKVVKFGGLKYFVSILQKYSLAIIEWFVCFCLCFFASNLIVDVDIDSSNTEMISLLKDELHKYKVDSFTFKKSYNELQIIKEKIKNNNKEKIEWLEIENIGMKYIVHIEERKIKKPVETPKYCHVYALKDGLVSKIKIFRGQSNLLQNDYVKKGDLLISGDITANDEVVQNVCADGKIFAEVWYTVDVSVPLDYKKYSKTGKKRYNIILDYRDKEYKIFNDRLKEFTSTKKEIFDALGLKIYLRSDYEIQKKELHYSLDEAVEKATLDAETNIKNKLKNDERILSKKILQKELNDSKIKVEVFIITEEQISYTKEINEVDNDI